MRFEDWQDRLTEVIEKHDALPFELGVSDCAILPIETIEAITGTLPNELELMRHYTDMESGQRRARELGCRNLAELFAKALPEIPVAFAGRGDVGIADYRGAIVGGGVVVVGIDLIGKGHEGTVRLPRQYLSRAFKVE
jgi:hypothetical protein